MYQILAIVKHRVSGFHTPFKIVKPAYSVNQAREIMNQLKEDYIVYSIILFEGAGNILQYHCYVDSFGNVFMEEML